MGRDVSELNLQLVMYDFNDTEDERDDNLIAGVAIRAEDAAAFAADVEKRGAPDNYSIVIVEV